MEPKRIRRAVVATAGAGIYVADGKKHGDDAKQFDLDAFMKKDGKILDRVDIKDGIVLLIIEGNEES